MRASAPAPLALRATEHGRPPGIKRSAKRRLGSQIRSARRLVRTFPAMDTRSLVILDFLEYGYSRLVPRRRSETRRFPVSFRITRVRIFPARSPDAETRIFPVSFRFPRARIFPARLPRNQPEIRRFPVSYQLTRVRIFPARFPRTARETRIFPVSFPLSSGIPDAITTPRQRYSPRPAATRFRVVLA